MTKKIKLTIQEIVKDFYNLGEKEGYISGLSEGLKLKEKDLNSYHIFLKEMIDKYIPNWKEKIDKRYWEKECTTDEKGLIISSILYRNFTEIFYKLI